MKQEITLAAPKTNITADCYGCDYQESEDPPQSFLNKLRGKPEKSIHRCKALSIELTDQQVNCWDMTKEECPCRFERWKQTNSELGEFVDIPSYILTVKDGKINAEEEKE